MSKIPEPRHYIAKIVRIKDKNADNGKWEWRDNIHPRLNEKGNPLFFPNDTLQLSMEDKAGPHELDFSPYHKTGTHWPFRGQKKAKHRYDSEVTLSFNPNPAGGAKVSDWKFDILYGSEKIDPEFQVGSGKVGGEG